MIRGVGHSVDNLGRETEILICATLVRAPPQRYGDNLSGNNIYDAVPFRGGGHGGIKIISHMNLINDAGSFRGGGHGGIEIISHMN